MVDLNNDGRDDVFMRKRAADGSAYWEYRLSDGETFGESVRSNLPPGTQEMNTAEGPFWSDRPGIDFFGSHKWTLYSELVLADLDANGVPEVGVRRSSRRGGYVFHTQTGPGKFEPFGPSFDILMPYLGDINGDGLPELVLKDNSAKVWRFQVNQPSLARLSYANQFDVTKNEAPDLSTSLVFDTDGDGQHEYLAQHTDPERIRLTYDSLTAAPAEVERTKPRWRESFLRISNGAWRNIFDANGDGLPDVVWANGRELVEGGLCR